MDVGKREDQMLDAISVLVGRRRMVLMQLELWDYAYPEMKPFCDDVRACLKGADQ